MDIAELIRNYGYLAVFAGSVLEGETVLALAGLAAHRGYLALPWVIATAAAGGFLGDQAYFFVGRRYGPRVLERFPRLRPGAARVSGLLDRHGTAIILGIRFLYGLRIMAPIAVGMSHVHWLRFALLNLAGAVLWAAIVAGLGYALGQALERVLGDLKAIEGAVFAAMLAAGVIALIVRRRRARSTSA